MIQNQPTQLSAQDALLAVMVSTSTCDDNLDPSELLTIELTIHHAPAFKGFEPERIRSVSNLVFALKSAEEGLDALFALIHEALPARLGETAYALACDVAAADGTLGQCELDILAVIREYLSVDRLAAAAIERGAYARHQTI